MDNQRKTIFLVDDDITNLTVGKKALNASYNVFTLSSGELMLEMLENIKPDMILLDVNMPGMDGYEAIKALKNTQKNADIPVIFLTAMGDEEAELNGLSLGAIDYITKPFSPGLLLKRIEIHLLVESQKQELLFINNNLEQLVIGKTMAVVKLKNAILSTMAELVEYRDAITGGHISRVQRYIKALIDSMKERRIYEYEVHALDEELVLQSCQLHDAGKIAVSDTILLKPTKLTPEEFDIIKTHTTCGEQIILRLKERMADSDRTSDNDFLEYARIFAIAHHEKWDGTGYPHGLKGNNIPILGRIMAIADVYDALVEERPYKKPFTHEKATQIILEGKGKHFDPSLVDLFENLNNEFEKIAAEVKS